MDLGGVRVLALLDAEGSFLTMHAAFPSAAGVTDEPWRLPFRAFLVEDGNRRVLVDAGVGPPPGAFLPERQGWLPNELARAGVDPHEIDVVVFTHLHVDHVGWAAVEGRPYFPRARYVTSRDDWRFFSARAASEEVFAEKLAPLERHHVLELIVTEAEVTPSVRAFPTPGHTPGHMSLRVAGAARELVIVGDVLLHPLQVDDPAAAYVFDVDAEHAASTRTELLASLAAGDTAVAAGHFPGSPFGTVEPGFTWRSEASPRR